MVFNETFKPLVLNGTKTFTCRSSEKEEDFFINETAFKAVKINEHPLRLFFDYINDGRYNPVTFGFATLQNMLDFYFKHFNEKKVGSSDLVYIYQLSRKYETHGLF